MSHSNRWPRLRMTMRMLPGFCLASTLLITFFLFPARASARAAKAPTTGPVMQVNAGFGTRYRNGNWIPVQITLSNDGTDFNGVLSIDATRGLPQYSMPSSNSSSSYQQPIALPNGARKQVTMYIPTYYGEQGTTVNLFDSNGHLLLSQNAVLRPLGTGDTFIATLSDQSTGFGSLSNVPLPNQGSSIVIESLTASTMPTLSAVLKNFNLIVLDNFTTGSLSRDQQLALQTWVSQGGALIVAGGPEWQHTFSSLPAGILPVAVNGTDILPAGTRLLPQGGLATVAPAQPASPGAVIVSTANPLPGSETVLASGTTPLIVQERYGQGTVCYLAFDPTLEPIAGWSGASSLWKSLLLRTVGDQLIVNNATQNPDAIGSSTLTGTTSILQSLLPNALPSPWLLLGLLLGYLVILGPLRLIIVRWLKRRDWSWRIALSTIVVFSLLTYGLALYQKGTSTLSGSISVERLGQNGAQAHVTTYVGVFVPNQGDFQLHIPNSTLVQPSPDEMFQNGPGSNGALRAIVSPGSGGTDVSLQNVSIWMQYSLIADQDRQIQGGMTSNLILRNSTLMGTVTNNLHYGLSDVYVLVANNAIPLGHLAPGQTIQVDFSLHSAGNSASLVDQIAQSNGLNAPYGPNADGSQPQNALQRHIAILTSLSGESGSNYCGPGVMCAKVVSVSSTGTGSIITLGGGSNLGAGDTSDPLLLTGSPVTLIGWADSSGDSTGSVTVNGGSPNGFHETLIQAPLPLHYSGQLNLQAGFFTGHVIDAQGTNLQTPAPGLYALSTGSMTFEFIAPAVPGIQINELTITIPSSASQILRMNAGGGTGALSDASHAHTLLYNWQTGIWDSLAMNQLTITTGDTGAYVGPGGRILLQISNQNTSLGTVIFGRPLLGLQATAPSQ